MTQWSKLAVVVHLLLVAIPSLNHAQAIPKSVTGPAQLSDLHFVISTKEGQTQFHLGEIIEIEESYSSDTSGRYLLVSLPQEVKGHSAELTIKPNRTVIDRFQDSGTRSAYSILHANCNAGIGSGSGGSWGPGTDVPLKSSPIRFMVNLSQQFQIMEPGHYSVQAEAANVVLAPLDLENSVPIALVSNALDVDVVDDPAWSKAGLEGAIAAFDAAYSQYITAGWNMLPWDTLNADQNAARTNLLWKLQSAAEVIRLLDTEESLAEIVRRYDGATPDRDFFRHVLLRGIIQSKHRSLAIKLLAARMLEPDFFVTKDFLDQLTAMTLEDEFPDSFARDDNASRHQLYPAARKILEEHIVALGRSLPEKRPGALESSLQAFKAFAAEDFCDGQPLLPEGDFKQMLRQVQAFDSEDER